MLMLKLSNALTGEETAQLRSTKADSTRHGFGLPGMREIAGRYGGSLETGLVTAALSFWPACRSHLINKMFDTMPGIV